MPLTWRSSMGRFALKMWISPITIRPYSSNLICISNRARRLAWWVALAQANQVRSICSYAFTMCKVDRLRLMVKISLRSRKTPYVRRLVWSRKTLPCCIVLYATIFSMVVLMPAKKRCARPLSMPMPMSLSRT